MADRFAQKAHRQVRSLGFARMFLLTGMIRSMYETSRHESNRQGTRPAPAAQFGRLDSVRSGSRTNPCRDFVRERVGYNHPFLSVGRSLCAYRVPPLPLDSRSALLLRLDQPWLHAHPRFIYLCRLSAVYAFGIAPYIP